MRELSSLNPEGPVHFLRLAAAILAIGAMIGPAGAQQLVPLTIAVVPSVPSASTYVALDKGYFRAAGLDVKIERIDSLSKAVAFVATNQVQVAQGGINAGVFNSIAGGLPVTLVLEAGSTPLYHRLLLRPDLKDKIKTPADLKGRSIGISAPGSTSVYEIAMVLEGAGLTIQDVDLKYITFPQMPAALANGAVEVALMVAPFSELAIEKKIGVAWIDPEHGHIKALPMTNVGYIANVDWINQNRELAKRAIVALARAGRDYCQAYHHGPNRSEVIDVLVSNKVVNDRALLDRMAWQARDPNGKFNIPSLLAIQSFFKRENIITREAPGERLADTSFTEAAAKELGAFDLINKASKLAGCR